MKRLHRQRKFLLVAASGFAGFFVLLLAMALVLSVAIRHMDIYDIGGSSFSIWDNIIVFGVAPIIITVGAGIPAWAVGMNLWRGFLAGGAATIAFILVHVSGESNWAPFIWYETFAFIASVLVSMLISTIWKNGFQPGTFISLAATAITLAILRRVVPGEGYIVGFVISLLAWIILPPLAALLTRKQEIET